MKHYLWKSRPILRQVGGLLFLGSLCGLVMNIAVILPPILLGKTIDTILAMGRGEASMSAVLWSALAFVGGTALYFTGRIGKRWWLRTAASRMVANVRADALRGVLSWPMAWLHKEPIGDLMARIMGDTAVYGVGLRELTTEAWDTWLRSISLVLAMLAYDAGLAVLALLPVPLAMFLAYASGRWVRKRTLAMREANADLTVALQEHLAGIRVLRLFGRTDTAVDRVTGLSQRQAEMNLAEARLRLGLQPIYTILITAGVILVVWLGGRRVIDGLMTTGALIAFMELYLRFVERGFRIPTFFNRLQQGGVAYARLQRLLAEPLPVSEEPPLASFQPAHIAGLYESLSPRPFVPQDPLSVSLQQVTFRYPAATLPALRDVSLDIPAASLVAITGPVGSGKSALARVLMGLYPLEGGLVLVDGRPLEQMPSAERAIRMGYLPQDPGLFSGSVLENISLGLPASEVDDALLDRVIACTSLERDLRIFPDGLESEIGEGGIRVSGGQQQRIALARALAISGSQTPGLLVLDDPFSAVDVETEGRIIVALREAFGPSAAPDRRVTIVLCSHRLAAFPHADLVVVLDGGRVVAQGTHDELLRAGGLYARIYRAQHQSERLNIAEETA